VSAKAPPGARAIAASSLFATGDDCRVDDVRLWVIGLGTVGRWLLRALHEDAPLLAGRYGLAPRVVGVANARDGFLYDPRGFQLPTLLQLVSAGRSLTEHPAVERWPTAAAGVAATDADVLVEVTASVASDGGEPGVTHLRAALERAIPVVTSNKWPVALHGVELAALSRKRGVAFRAESTVMSGTPVLSSLVEGLAGARPTMVRGVLNATVNFILTRMESGASYEDALDAAQRQGLAERDPSADVDGHDAMAKAMVLAGLVFGEQLRPENVVRRGIAGIDRAEVEAARASGAHLKQLVTVERSTDGLIARVEPSLVSNDDPLAQVTGATNALTCRAEPVGEVTIIGPGAGPQLAGQGVLSDLLAAVR
jgi:homoserine dehydrogenase